jgi:cell wall assembly regulator SMI1
MKPWLKVSIGIAGSLFILGGLAFWTTVGTRNFFYPTAPPMPPVVNESMPEILARLEAVLKTNAPSVSTNLRPGISQAEILKLEQRYHVQLPDEIKAIYQWHDGSVSDTNRLVDFIPIHRFVPLEEALETREAVAPEKASLVQRIAYHIFVSHRESWICLFDDGAGDGYWFDPKRKPAEGAIFSNFTEEASYTFFPSPKNLMAGIAACYEQGAFRIKKDSSPQELDEDFEESQKIWNQFGVSK